MPTYLLHGFRWERHNIRVHIVLNDLEDAAPEWIVAPATSVTLLNSFYTNFDFLPPSNPPPASYPLATAAEEVLMREEVEEEVPQIKLSKVQKKASMGSLRDLVRRSKSTPMLRDGGVNGKADVIPEGQTHEVVERRGSSAATSTSAKSKPPAFNDWSVVKLVEQHDPESTSCTSQPYAYVADYIIEVELGVSILDEMAKYETRIKEEAESSSPGTPATPGFGPDGCAAVNGESNPPLSARDLRKKNRRLGWFEKLREALQKDEEIGWHVVVCGDEERPFPSIEEEEEEEDYSSEGEEMLKTPRSAALRGFFGKKKETT